MTNIIFINEEKDKDIKALGDEYYKKLFKATNSEKVKKNLKPKGKPITFDQYYFHQRRKR